MRSDDQKNDDREPRGDAGGGRQPPLAVTFGPVDACRAPLGDQTASYSAEEE